jgi:hypothetical protein
MDETTTATEAPDSGAPQIEAPLLLYCVFGLPVFITVAWFFVQFTRPDRFGRVDRAAIAGAEPEGEERGDPAPDAAEKSDPRG